MKIYIIKKKNSLIFSVVFWFGDLNFRIEDLEMHAVKAAIDNNKLSMLWEKDQVRDIQVKLLAFLLSS